MSEDATPIQADCIRNYLSNFFDSSSISICKYACRRSILLNFCPPPRKAKILSILGTGLTVCLKSLHSRTFPFFFITGTGVAHSLQSNLVKMPSFCNLVKSVSTFGRRTYGTCLALQNFGWLVSFRFSFALVVFNRPISSSKTSLYLLRISCNRVDSLLSNLV